MGVCRFGERMMLKIIKASSPRRFVFDRNRIALIDLKNVVNGSNNQWRGKSYAASIPSNAPKSPKARKITRDERKAMVESFVNKYKVTHDGKFPTTTDVRKHVGGSYYVLKIILQELLQSKSSSPDEIKKLLEDGQVKECNVSVDGTTENVTDKVAANSVKTDDVNDKAAGAALTISAPEKNMFEEAGKLRAPDGQPDFTALQNNLMKENSDIVNSRQFTKPESAEMEEAQENRSDFVTKETHLLNKQTDKTLCQGHDTSENSKKEKPEKHPPHFVTRECNLLKGETEEVSNLSFGIADVKEEPVLTEVASDSIKHETEQSKGSPKPERSAVDTSSRQTEDAAVLKKSTLWGNLKSIADGFFSMWRKS